MSSLLQNCGFLNHGIDPTLALPRVYDPILVTLPVLIASLAAYAELGLTGRISAADTPTAKRSWLAAGAITTGIGVWAIHFSGMLAFRLPIRVHYDIPTTLVSMLPSIVASGIMLHVISQARMAAVMLYDPVLFVLSVVVAVVLATAALYTKFLAGGTSHSHWIKLGAALVMGSAVAGMHYTGMAAAYFFPDGGAHTIGPGLEPTRLGAWVSLATVLITGLAIFVTIIDSRLEAAAHSERLSRARLLEAIESISEVSHDTTQTTGSYVQQPLSRSDMSGCYNQPDGRAICPDHPHCPAPCAQRLPSGTRYAVHCRPHGLSSVGAGLEKGVCFAYPRHWENGAVAL